ncbi:MAG: GNAT family N-acetyltransferase [Chloroflexota bacterium]
MTSDFLSVRSATSNDAEILSRIRRKAILELAAGRMGREQAQSWAESAGPKRVQIAIEEHQVCVIEVEEQVVGWIEYDRNQIKGLYVQPELACQGIGSQLLADAEKRIESDGYTSILLHASLNAEQFYVNRGYKPVSERSPSLGLAMAKYLEVENV